MRRKGYAMTDVDVVIIGAGIAGLSAARAVADAGCSFRVLEASHRIGGRAYSEPYATGGMFDLGCSYLHEGDTNPLKPVAAALGIELGNGDRFASEEWRLLADAVPRPASDHAAYWDFANGVDARMELLGNDNARDTAVGDLMNWDSPIAPLYVHLMAGLNASDVTEQSAVDYMRSGFGRDYPVRGGLGSLVAKWGADIPVTLNCRVGAVNMTGRDVTVTSNHGDLRTKRVIITVSTGILAAGDILFTPALPDTVTTAIDHLPCGTLNKIGVALAPGAVPPDADGWHLSWPDHDMDALSADQIASVDIYTGETPQAVVFAGASFGIHLEKAGAAAMRAYAENSLVSILGSDIRNAIEGMITTAWHSEPLTLGSYSYARPGGADARGVLQHPVDDRLYFAGEATSIAHYGTAHGAFLSGQDAGQRVVADITLP